jgi:hypothetical protein
MPKPAYNISSTLTSASLMRRQSRRIVASE